MHLGICSFLSSIEIHLLKVTQIALSKYERGNGAKKSELFLVSKVEFNFYISSGIKTLPFDPAFSSWVYVIRKAPIINRSRTQRALRLSIFFFEIDQLKALEKTRVFFSFLAFIFSNFVLAMFIVQFIFGNSQQKFYPKNGSCLNFFSSLPRFTLKLPN